MPLSEVGVYVLEFVTPLQATFGTQPEFAIQSAVGAAVPVPGLNDTAAEQSDRIGVGSGT